MPRDGRLKTLRRLESSLVAAVLLFLCAGPAWGQGERGRDPAGLLASGRDAYEAGDYDRARADLWAYLDRTASMTGPSRLPQAEALYYIAIMEPDAAVAAQHYRTILEEYPAATVADLAIQRLGQYTLVAERPGEARQLFERLQRDYPFSRAQPELPLWIGRTWLAEGDARAAVVALLEGFTRIKGQDLPVELSRTQLEALAAEYAWWLATAYRQAGDPETASQYYTMLVLDYPRSPLAVEAQSEMAAMGRPVAGAGDVVLAPTAGEPRREEGGRPPEVGPGVEAPREVNREEERRREEEARRAEEIRREEEARRAEEARREEESRRAEEARRAEEVRREAVSPAPPADLGEPAKFPPPGGTGAVWLQVGAFSSATNAAELSKRLRADGFDTKVEVGIVEGRGYYRVRVGPYVLPGEAARLESAHSRLVALGYPARAVNEGE